MRCIALFIVVVKCKVLHCSAYCSRLSPPPSLSQAAQTIPLMATTPQDNDVLYCRDIAVLHHPGNQQFLTFIASVKAEFDVATLDDEQRISLARNITDSVYKLDPPGRFLTKDEVSGSWEVMADEDTIIRRVLQAFHDARIPDQRPPSLSDDVSAFF